MRNIFIIAFLALSLLPLSGLALMGGGATFGFIHHLFDDSSSDHSKMRIVAIFILAFVYIYIYIYIYIRWMPFSKKVYPIMLKKKNIKYASLLILLFYFLPIGLLNASYIRFSPVSYDIKTYLTILIQFAAILIVMKGFHKLEGDNS